LQDLILAINSLPKLPPAPVYVPNQRISTAIKLAQTHRQVVTIPWQDMTNDLFEYITAQEFGCPIVILGVTEKFQFRWSPEFFIKYAALGRQTCDVQNCHTGQVYSSTVEDFFRKYGDESEDREVLRLKVIQLLLRVIKI
jgi:hypothetical protein